MNVTIWDEFQQSEAILKVYPKGIHTALHDALKVNADMNIRVALLDDPQCGLSDEVLNSTDVLLWWGHCRHNDVPDELAEKIAKRVNLGMGLIVLHSAHMSKPFTRLMGTSCSLRWREANEKEYLWNILPAHEIAKGVGEYIMLPQEEMYGECFDIPTPDELVFIGWFKGGNVFRSGCCFERGRGKVFYFQPGHETHPTYYDENIKKIITNAVRWAAPKSYRENLDCSHDKELEKL